MYTQPLYRMQQTEKKKKTLTKWQNQTDKCVKLVYAITDLEEITKTMKRTHKMKTCIYFVHSKCVCWRWFKKKKNSRYCHATYVRSRCTRLEREIESTTHGYVRSIQTSSIGHIRTTLIAAATHKTNQPFWYISYEYKTKKYGTLLFCW